VTQPAAFWVVTVGLVLVFAWNLHRAFRTGYAGLDSGGFRRERSPVLFWAAVVVSAAGLLFMLALILFALWRHITR
jgi:hypothetical protein